MGWQAPIYGNLSAAILGGIVASSTTWSAPAAPGCAVDLEASLRIGYRL
jgi:hypothetical protein